MADLMPETKFYKAFNTVGVEQMDPTPGTLLNTKSPTMLFCGPEEDKDTIKTLIEHSGWAAKYVGGLKYSRNLEVRRTTLQGEPACCLIYKGFIVILLLFYYFFCIYICDSHINS